MKCSHPKCKEDAIFVIIDAYLPDGNSIERKEMVVLPQCISHHDLQHKTLEGRGNRTMAKKMEIV
jgi:hypothetical protein